MTTKPPMWTYHLYQRLAGSPALHQSPEEMWEINNGTTYRYIAEISATSASCAAAYTLGQRISKEQGAATLVGGVGNKPSRIARPGDVLVGNEYAWMITSAGDCTQISYSWPHSVAAYDVSDLVYEVAWSPDEEQLAGVGNRKVFLRRLKGDRTQYYEYHRRSAHSISWAPQGGRIASVDGGGDVHFWSIAQTDSFDASQGRIIIARPLIESSTKDAMRTVRWSPSKNMVAAGRACGTVFLLDPDTAEELFVYKGHQQMINALAWSPDGLSIASGSDDRTIQVWGVRADATPEVVYRGHKEAVRSLAWSPEGHLIASAAENAQSIHVWNPQTGTLVKRIPLSVSYARTKPYGTSLSWSPKGNFLAVGCADGTVQVLDVALSSHIRTYRMSRNQEVATVAWSPKGNYIACGGDDCKVTVWALDK